MSGKKVLLKDDGTWEYVASDNNSDYDFRNTYWGMNKDAVKKTEKEEPDYEEKDFIGYKVTIVNLDCILFYSFVNNHLNRAKYIISEKHTNKNDYIDDYKGLFELLSKKYGEPGYDNVIWKNDLYKDDNDHWGMAISAGHLIYEASWELDKTDILIQLAGDNYDINFLIQYTAKEFKDLEIKLNEQNTLDEL